MLALAFLTIAAVTEHQPTPARLTPRARNEIAHLTATRIDRGRP